MLRADGTTVFTDVTAHRTTLLGKVCTVAVFRDAAPRRLREQEFLQRQQLESLGTVAGGIAHDFNNILAGLIGHLSLAQMEIDEAHVAHESLAEVERAAMRATALARQLLTFAKGGHRLRKRTDLVRVIEDYVAQFGDSNRLRLTCALKTGQYFVLGDEGQLVR